MKKVLFSSLLAFALISANVVVAQDSQTTPKTEKKSCCTKDKDSKTCKKSEKKEGCSKANGEKKSCCKTKTAK